MRKFWKWMLVVGSLLSGLLLGVPVAHAQGVGYAILPLRPTNQQNSKVTYYDIHVKPGQRQQIAVIIKNTQSQPQRLQVQVNQAVTDSAGVIDYSQAHPELDPTLQVNMPKLFSQPNQTVTVPADGSKKITLGYQVPTTPFKGQLLGGLYIKQTQPGKRTNKGRIAIRNLYAYDVSILMQEGASVNADLHMHRVGVSQDNQHRLVYANLQNAQPGIMRSLSTKTTVTPMGSTKIVLSQNKPVQMAPNSNFNYQLPWGNTILKPGKYTLHMTARNGQHEWFFVKNFTVTQKETQSLTPANPRAKRSLWLYILLAIIIALLLATIAYLLYRNHKNQQSQA